MAEQSSQLSTLGDILNYAANEFERAQLYFGHGTDNAWDEAVALALHVFKLPHTVSRDVLTMPLQAAQKQTMLDLIQQRITTRKPLAYLIHEAYFCGLPFYVDEHVLIPRSPIAELIQTQFTPWIDPDKVKNIIDIGTGSGCIAIACALAFPHAQVDAVDIDSHCLDIAHINAKKHQVENQLNLIQSNLFESVPSKRYDIIVSNPPYVDQGDMNSLPQEYLHEPQKALFGGNDGLDLVKIILQQAKQRLNPHGILVVEVGNSEAALMEQFPHLPFTWLEFECGGDGVFLLTAEEL